ncbi:MAG: DUF1206 domain-containing protein [Mycobacterium sp.]
MRSKVARVGLIGKGALYSLLGFLAINIALGNRDSATETGAIQTVAQAPFGKFLLIALTAALIALVGWKLLQAIAGDPVEGSEASDRAKYAAKGFLYGGAALTSLSILIANWGGAPSGGGSGGGGQQKATAVVMDLPGGRWIVMLAGLVAVGFGCYSIYRYSVKAEFMEHFGSLQKSAKEAVEKVGRLAYAGNGGVVIGVGVFLFLAGLNYDPNNVKGLSGILAELAGQSWGQLVLWLLAIGVLAYGVFAFIEARYRRAT